MAKRLPNDPYVHGVECRVMGQEAGENPYPIDSEKADLWRRGWAEMDETSMGTIELWDCCRKC